MLKKALVVHIYTRKLLYLNEYTKKMMGPTRSNIYLNMELYKR